MDGLKRLLSSRKAWSLAVSGCLATLLQVLGLAAAWQGWPADRVQAVQSAAHLLAGLAVAAGGWLSLLIAGESAARDWGVTEPTPQETLLKQQALAELAAKLPADIRAALLDSQRGRPVS